MNPIEITSWSHGGDSTSDKALETPQKPCSDGTLPFTGEARYYTMQIECPASGTLALQIESPRPIRIHALGELLLDEPLAWRSFQRKVFVCA